jgi:hypothetical protein
MQLVMIETAKELNALLAHFGPNSSNVLNHHKNYLLAFV